MTPPYLSLIEGGQRTPSAKALAHIAKKLEVEVDELERGTPSNLLQELELALQEARGLAHRGSLDEADHTLDALLSKSRRYRLDRVTARALCLRGSIREKRGDFVGARDHFEDALALLADEPAHTRFEAVVGSARSTRSLGDLRLAVYVLDSYLVELEQQGMNDPTATMRVHSVLVGFYRALGLERKSIESAEQALRLAPLVDDPEQVACMNMNVARALLDQGRHDDALAALRQAEQTYQSLDWPLPAARAHVNAGIVALDKNSLDFAYEMFTRALAALEPHPHERTEIGAVLNLLGRVERLRGDLDSAMAHLMRARKVLPKDDAFETATNSHELGLVLSVSDPRRAERELRRAADTYKATGAKPDAARALLELGRLLMKRDDAKSAANVLAEGLELTAASKV